MSDGQPTPYDIAYQTRRARIAAAVAATAARALAAMWRNEQETINTLVRIVEAGQQQTAALIDAYMAAKALQSVNAGTVIGLDPARYTISALRNGVPAADVYRRAFNTLTSAPTDPLALERAQTALDKLVRTDLQLAQTHAARDWMTAQAKQTSGDTRIVGYKRVLTGAGPHCRLCELASTRIYHVEALMPIHEHCSCTVEPVWGKQEVSSIGTAVRVEIDPELGPRLLAGDWSSVGPSLH